MFNDEVCVISYGGHPKRLCVCVCVCTFHNDNEIYQMDVNIRYMCTLKDFLMLVVLMRLLDGLSMS
jgi:hypothetical protein